MKKFYKYILCFALLVCVVCFNFRSVKASATVTLTEGVSIRTNGDNGLMFEASVSNSIVDAEYGMVFIRGINNNFDVNSDGAFAASVTEVDEYNKYRVTMIKFPDSAFGTNISVKAFIKVGDNYTYSSNTVTCNLYEKAVTYKNSSDYNNEELIDYIVDNTYLSFVAYTGSNTTLHSTMVNDFMKDFNEYFGLNVSYNNFFNATYDKNNTAGTSTKYVDFFTTSTYAKKWNWMLNYINEVRVEKNLSILNESTYYPHFRGNIHCFLNLCDAADLGTSFTSYGIDFSTRSDYRYNLSGKAPYAMPELVKTDYVFEGWCYDSTLNGIIVTNATSNSPLYPKFITKEDADQGDQSNLEFLKTKVEIALGYVSDIAGSNTNDTLLVESDNVTFTYSSSNPILYVINDIDGSASVSKVYQTHKEQSVTVNVTGSYSGMTYTDSKEIVINPVVYSDFSDTPVATYFATSAAYSYKTYSERYKTEKTLFSNDAKDVLDIVYYAFATINADGTCQLVDSSYVHEVNELKANNTRIIVSLNGAVSDGQINFYNITRDETLLATLIDNVCDMVEKYNFDGVDIDWEYNSNYPTEKTYYTKLVTGLYNELASRQDDGGTPYMLTAAIPGTSWGTSTNRYDYEVLNTYLDYINVMSYDLNEPNYTTHLSPLYTPSSANSYSFSLDYAVSRFESLGFPAEKLILGCAGYGKLYKITGTINSSATYVGLGLSGTLTQYANTVGSYASGTLFGNAIITLKNTGNFKEYHNYNNSGKFVGSYLYSESESLFVTYDSLFALEEKYKYAANLEGTGLMCWSYTENTDDSFITAISNQK